MMAARWEWIFSITNILFFKKSYKSVFYEKIFLNFYLKINLIFWKTLYRLDKHAFCLNLALLVASINICHDCNLCLTGFLVPWVSNSEGLVQLFGCEHWAMTRLVCCDACLSLGSYPFLERAHAVIAYTVFWSNAVWATLNAWQPLTYMLSEESGSVLLDASASELISTVPGVALWEGIYWDLVAFSSVEATVLFRICSSFGEIVANLVTWFPSWKKCWNWKGHWRSLNPTFYFTAGKSKA